MECGALDGERESTTLTLEKDFAWSGVLIEASPIEFNAVLSKNRKSVMVPACLSYNASTSPLVFIYHFNTFRN